MALSYRQLLVAVPLVIKGGNVPNIVGEAGIGKSALVQDVAKRNHAKLFTTVVSLVEKGDLSIPVPPLTSDSFIKTKHYGTLADVQFGYSHTLIEIIKYAERYPDTSIYWFLDEFNRGSQAVQSELMNLVLQRSVNSLKLPKQVHIIIAENPDSSMTGFGQTDYGVVSGDAAIKDRTVRLVMKANLKDWLAWANTQDLKRHRQMIHPSVIKYLQENPGMLHNPKMSQDLYPTPRAWERVSDNLYELDQLDNQDRQSIQLDVLSGDLGIETATAFNSFLNQSLVAITPKSFVQDSLDKLTERFNKMDEAQKEHTLRMILKAKLSLNDDFAKKFLTLLTKVSSDGQYSLALSLSHTDWFDHLYNQIKSSQSLDLQKLYEAFIKISLAGY
ncbi:ATP-binding protein [Acetilactobacillus jinshanensis]|uniref:ATP-binding protein n=1 Tax=Acetilactobacillus jinshanensis TaxID=1720083 RepID=A0A4P6ZN24_9LACO|nr:ATP-binding protein [Acetilactobacillus jinshanensis]QBP18610.1 ATP-binding protein [Acetilactobacillus jinshanensis]URL61486.1 ATP-binding protein [uncultured bacterium]